MTKNYSVRTDLALEERERFESDQVEISGVILEEDYDESSETRITRVIKMCIRDSLWTVGKKMTE